MRLSTAKKYRKKHRLLGALFLDNPVLVMGLDLPFVITMATSLKRAVAMSIQLLFIHVITMMVARKTRKLPLQERAMANVAASTVVMIFAQALVVHLFQGISNSLGMYLYLMAVNSMTILQSNSVEKHAKIWPVFTGALFNVLGFSVAVLFVSFIRELLGSGALWGIPVRFPVRLSALNMPFSGFILVGFLLALTRYINKRWAAYALAETERREARMNKIYIQSVEEI